MKSQTIRDMMIAGTFELASVGAALLDDANNLIRLRHAQTDDAIRSCYQEQLQKYNSALRKYQEFCEANTMISSAYGNDEMQEWFTAQGGNIARLLKSHAKTVPAGTLLWNRAVREKKTDAEARESIIKVFADLIPRFKSDERIVNISIQTLQPLEAVCTDVALATYLELLVEPKWGEDMCSEIQNLLVRYLEGADIPLLHIDTIRDVENFKHWFKIAHAKAAAKAAQAGAVLQ